MYTLWVVNHGAENTTICVMDLYPLVSIGSQAKVNKSNTAKNYLISIIKDLGVSIIKKVSTH